jgi:DNA helicase-2/ATP-dependent DNA helicase PcrA
MTVMTSPEAQKILPPGAWSRLHAFMMTYQRWQARFQQSGRLAELIKDYLTEMEFLTVIEEIYRDKEERDRRARRENLYEFINSAAQLEERIGQMASLGDFLETYGLMDDQDRVKEKQGSGNAVNLMTVHAAKGTEFAVVMIVGLEEEFFPHARSMEENGLEEERRLFYVAMTRAKQQVYMIWAQTRSKFYQRERRYPSRFIKELPQENIDHVQERDLFMPANSNYVSSVFAEMKEQF